MSYRLVSLIVKVFEKLSEDKEFTLHKVAEVEMEKVRRRSTYHYWLTLLREADLIKLEGKTYTADLRFDILKRHIIKDFIEEQLAYWEEEEKRLTELTKDVFPPQDLLKQYEEAMYRSQFLYNLQHQLRQEIYELFREWVPPESYR